MPQMLRRLKMLYDVIHCDSRSHGDFYTKYLILLVK